MSSINSKVVGSAVAVAVGFLTLSASILQLTGVKLETSEILKVGVAALSAVVALVLSRYFSRAEGDGK